MLQFVVLSRLVFTQLFQGTKSKFRRHYFTQQLNQQ